MWVSIHKSHIVDYIQYYACFQYLFVARKNSISNAFKKTKLLLNSKLEDVDVRKTLITSFHMFYIVLNNVIMKINLYFFIFNVNVFVHNLFLFSILFSFYF